VSLRACVIIVGISSALAMIVFSPSGLRALRLRFAGANSHQSPGFVSQGHGQLAWAKT
jgi:hypothetical protein